MARFALWPSCIAAMLLLAPACLSSQSVVATGALTAVWGDPPARSGAPGELRWFLADDRGQVLEVEVAAEVLQQAGGVLAVDRRRVTVPGRLTQRAGARPADPPVLRATSLEGLEVAPSLGLVGSSRERLGSQAYAVILCRFADRSVEPRDPAFFEALMGPEYPNMDHYFRELSAGQMDLGGTRVFGWYTLPYARAHYFDGATNVISLPRLANDCTAAAAREVDYSRFVGIIAQFNDQLAASGQGSAYGGSLAMAVDGATRVWPFMWMPLWAMEHSRYGVYAHELGHSLGLPHSSGPYDRIYDSAWDVMSNPYLHYDRTIGAWVPGQTIAFHKDLLGWIPAERKVVVAHAGELSLRLEPHSTGPGNGGPLYVEVRIPGTPDSYTIEARARTGYDGGLPGETVIMHRVPDPAGPDCTPHRCARVIDAYGNGNPNDGGAMWSPGETFDDGTGVRVSVTAPTPTGWDLELSVLTPARPPGLTVERAAAALLGTGDLTAEEAEYLDLMGNRNGRFDLGDFLALVRREAP